MPTQLTWLLDERADEAGVNDLRPAIKALGDRHLTISRQEARFGTAWQTLPLHASPTLAYGSIEFAKAIRPELYPGKWCDWNALRCERYYPAVADLLLNDDYLLLPAGELLRRHLTLLQQSGTIFIRPVRADKPFSGFVAGRDAPEEIERQLRSVEAQELVVFASVKPIEAEYRAVAVRNQGIIAVSQYRQDNQLTLKPEMPAEARRIAEAVVAALGSDFPDPMFVVDIAASQGQYRLLEINSFSTSQFYACDLDAIVRAARAEALRDWHESQS